MKNKSQLQEQKANVATKYQSKVTEIFMLFDLVEVSLNSYPNIAEPTRRLISSIITGTVFLTTAISETRDRFEKCKEFKIKY